MMFESVKKLLVKELQIDEHTIKPNAALAADLKLNSLELAEFVLTCEEALGITIEDDDLKKLVTVGDIAEYIEKAKNKS